jgi:hypothetical protein
MCWSLINDNDLLEFLCKVAKSKTLQAEFQKDPKGLMQKEGLPQKYQDVLLTHNRDEFLDAIARRH